jgi:serine/threonine protein phosphatase PrpC
MKLIGLITDGSGATNEDACGYMGDPDAPVAAWVFDGVTGINPKQHLPGDNDAAWLVRVATAYLLANAAKPVALQDLLKGLVETLIAAWRDVSKSLDLPHDYDPPASCLVLVKRYGESWQSLRLGDSCLLSRETGGGHRIHAASPNNTFDHWLAAEAKLRRESGQLDIKALLAEFRPQLLAARKKRNQPDGYSILEASESALTYAEYGDLGTPEAMLLCTDGFYRAVDHYQLYDDVGLIETCLEQDGVTKILAQLRETEAADPHCLRYLRFKPADDATALVLGK